MCAHSSAVRAALRRAALLPFRQMLPLPLLTERRFAPLVFAVEVSPCAPVSRVGTATSGCAAAALFVITRTDAAHATCGAACTSGCCRFGTDGLLPIHIAIAPYAINYYQFVRRLFSVGYDTYNIRYYLLGNWLKLFEIVVRLWRGGCGNAARIPPANKLGLKSKGGGWRSIISAHN